MPTHVKKEISVLHRIKDDNIELEYKNLIPTGDYSRLLFDGEKYDVLCDGIMFLLLTKYTIYKYSSNCRWLVLCV